MMRLGTKTAATALALCFVALHAVQIASPLRLNTDAQRLLLMAGSAADGHGFLVHGEQDYLPTGYPALVFVLIKLGLGSAPWLAAANLFAVLAGCALFFILLQSLGEVSPAGRWLLAIAPLASWIFIKHVSIPLTESLYFGVSMAALAAWWRCWRAGRGREIAAWCVTAVALGFVAFKVRTVGAALMATAAPVLAFHPHLQNSARLRSRPWLIAGSVVIVGGGLATWLFLLRHTGPREGYLQQQWLAMRSGEFVETVVRSRLLEFAELVVNFPLGRFPMFAWGGIGFIAIAGCAVGWLRLLRKLPPVAFYTAIYTAIIVVWPYYDPRFWMPLLGVLALCLALTLREWPALRVACASVFFGLGLLALLYSVRLSLSGPAYFADHYGGGSYRAGYRAAYGLPHEAGEVAPDVVVLVRRFDPHAQP